MRVLLAFDAFKGTLSANDASALVAGVLAEHGIETVQAPIADGGDGTLDVLLTHGYSPVEVDVVDAALRPRAARIGRRGDSIAIELAEICGLVTVADLPLDAWHRSTLGLGRAARAAVDAGATQITLCVGGSASVDGGIGLLQGLGFAVVDDRGAAVTPDLAGMIHATRIDAPMLASVQWRVLVDVETPIAGRASTAMVFGPQKGLTAHDCVHGDEALRHWAALLERTFGVDVRELPGGGAAGGVAAAAHAALGAELVSGAATIIDMTGLAELMRTCDAVITGEGSFDAQSLLGKGPGLVCVLAHENSTPVFLLAGRVDSDAARRAKVACAFTCVDAAGAEEKAVAEPRRWLNVAAERLARSLH